jgi:Phosphatidylserine/phosphatidylglycerophosphate/cardiolipin synthases and related enzymes
VKFLAKLRERGMQVRILTNSLASTDMPVVHSAYQKYRIPLLESGVELYEVRPILGQPVVRGDALKSPSAGQFALHAKVFVFDRQRVFVGSMNLDQRSLHVNTEVGVIIDSPDLARQVATRFEAIARPANSYVLALDGTNVAGGRALVWRTWKTASRSNTARSPRRRSGAGRRSTCCRCSRWTSCCEWASSDRFAWKRHRRSRRARDATMPVADRVVPGDGRRFRIGCRTR